MKKELTIIRPWWSTETHHWMTTCCHPCSSYRVGQPDLTSQCHTQPKWNMALPVADHSLHQYKGRSQNERAPTHDYKLNQDVMYLDPVSKKWFPATIVHLMDAERSYLIKTPEGVDYRKTQQHLKPYKERKVCVPPTTMKDSDPVQGRPKRDTKPPKKLDV